MIHIILWLAIALTVRGNEIEQIETQEKLDEIKTNLTDSIVVVISFCPRAEEICEAFQNAFDDASDSINDKSIEFGYLNNDDENQNDELNEKIGNQYNTSFPALLIFFGYPTDRFLIQSFLDGQYDAQTLTTYILELKAGTPDSDSQNKEETSFDESSTSSSTLPPASASLLLSTSSSAVPSTSSSDLPSTSSSALPSTSSSDLPSTSSSNIPQNDNALANETNNTKFKRNVYMKFMNLKKGGQMQ